MSPFAPVVSVLPSAVPTSSDVRAVPLDLMHATAEQSRRLSGEACARCGGTGGLRPGGMAYTLTGPDGQGRLAWLVQVCAEHARTGGTW